MADSKITALTSISTSTDPANDPLVIVDVSDTSMAATGTTKKVTLNQLLGASGTATLASATITGDLTVDTSTLKVDSANNRVGIGTASPTGVADFLSTVVGNSNVLTIGNNEYGAATYLSSNSVSLTFNRGQSFKTGAIVSSNTTNGNLSEGYIAFQTSTSNVLTERYRIDNTGISTWSVGGSTAMTLNSTGLGVGVSPSYALHVLKTISGTVSTSTPLVYLNSNGNGSTAKLELTDNVTGNARVTYRSASGTPTLGFGCNGYEQLVLTDTGNVGIGVTPSAWFSGYTALQIPAGSFAGYLTATLAISQNSFFSSATSDNRYVNNGFASRYLMVSGGHQWFTAPSGTAGNAITFTQAMTLDASGNLLVGSTSNPTTSRLFLKGDGSHIPVLLEGTSGDTTIPHLVIRKYDNNSTTSQLFVQFVINNNAAGSGQINANGASQAAFGSYSDSRLKENIVSLPSQLANILSLRPVEFDYKDGSGHQIGFVAQEMQEIYSDAVGEQEGFLTVTGWGKTEARLVSAIKELAAKVQALEAKLA